MGFAVLSVSSECLYFTPDQVKQIASDFDFWNWWDINDFKRESPAISFTLLDINHNDIQLIL